MKHRTHDILRAVTGVRLHAARAGRRVTLPAPVPTRSGPHGGADARVALERILDDVAQRIADDGTRTQHRVLTALSAATETTSPGAAAALVDWDGSEIARLRAFGLVSAVVLHVLDPRARRLLLDRILGPDLALAG
jgi:hypothetical protein